jgi:hypothetical protein
MAPGSKQRHKAERDLVLARLAAVETLGLLGQKVEQTSSTDETAARARIKNAMLPGVIDDAVATQVLDMLLRKLRDSPLNINFKANEFFAETQDRPLSVEIRDDAHDWCADGWPVP